MHMSVFKSYFGQGFLATEYSSLKYFQTFRKYSVLIKKIKRGLS